MATTELERLCKKYKIQPVMLTEAKIPCIGCGEETDLVVIRTITLACECGWHDHETQMEGVFPTCGECLENMLLQVEAIGEVSIAEHAAWAN